MRDRVIQVVAEQFGYEGDEIASLTEATTLKGDLHADSLELLDLSFRIEKEFGVVLADGDLSEVKTIGDIIAALEPAS